MGWDAILAPALDLRATPPARLPRAQAILLPSRAAARAMDPVLAVGRGTRTMDRAPIPVLAVGDGTAAEARARGFPDVRAAEGDAASLTDLAAATLDPLAGPLLLAVGRGYSAALATALRERGFRVLRRVVYAAAPAESLPPAAVAALSGGRVAAALFTSPRGAAVTVAALRRAGLSDCTRAIRAIAISPRIATALAALPWAGIETTPRPDPALLLHLLGPPPG